MQDKTYKPENITATLNDVELSGVEIDSEDHLKTHHIMFCYTWRANNESGNGSNIFQNETKELTMKDIDEAVEFIKIFIEKRMNHSKDSISVIFTNIIHLSYCTREKFYNNK